METLGTAPRSVNLVHIGIYVCSHPVYLGWVPRWPEFPCPSRCSSFRLPTRDRWSAYPILWLRFVTSWVEDQAEV